MSSNGIDNGLITGLRGSEFTGNANGLMSNNAVISDVNTFISTWDTNPLIGGVPGTKTITLPTIPLGTYRFWVNWGDGKKNFIKTFDDPLCTHTYPAPGVYTVRITGIFKGWSFAALPLSTDESVKLISIERFGCLEVIDYVVATIANNSFFYYCINLNLLNVKDILNTSNITTFEYMFAQIKTPTINLINNWNTNKVTNFSNAFSLSNFNSPIEKWNPTKVTNMSAMFRNASFFNQPLQEWGSNVNSVTNMAYMFSQALSYNQPMLNWRVDAVTTMANMFENATSFDQMIGGWKPTSCTNFTGFMTGVNMSQTAVGGNPIGYNLGEIYQRWPNNKLQYNLTADFGLSKYSNTTSSIAGRKLLSEKTLGGGSIELTLDTISNNGGLVQVNFASSHGLITGDKILIYGTSSFGNTLNQGWFVTVLTTTSVTLDGSVYSVLLTPGFAVTSFGWVLTDGGLAP